MTNVTTVLSNFMYRRSAERVETEEPEDIEETLDLGPPDNNSIVEEDDEEGEFIGTSTGAENRSVSTGNISAVSSLQTPTIEALPHDEDVGRSSNNDNDVEINVNLTNEDTSETSPTTAVEAPGPTTVRVTSTSRHRNVRGITLRDLEEERELLQRRTGGCVLLSSFILLRLWIQALMSGDLGLLLLCLVFTSWTARFVRYTREREEELNRMINEWDETSDEGTSINDVRLSRMSFQSQLTLAIMQSQIQMMEGGYGHPDGGENKPGVSDEAKARWDRFEYESISSLMQRGDCESDVEKEGDGSRNDVAKVLGDDTPTCSICLSEYEKGDKLVSLPCKHVFLEDCITSWTNHNTRCPLCNFDLNTDPVYEAV
mmetsp:Transcript_24044/g.56741  ORF Transcript_24044/g.56741 Transcript_24044/m.56741 type:complete len:372 (-) Transcript_24044:242-1357(-)|eukprot:CAMPEP_0197185132 /NCGR_PEP_ID=MMETSP1423-20130617/11223_1 /TAXON_ID=476441 /ORGANISM="Pseudo-nitzschia heimii, Strain UNC1101" /LENGTH=371 /DNA_ID=CAMNT_0042636107 /DNA_START=81 /DNA_END=1196 /DNA_ORIENTATION=+